MILNHSNLISRFSLVFLLLLLTGSLALAATPATRFDGSDNPIEKPTPELISINKAPGMVDFDAALQAGADYLRHAQADVTEDNAGNGTDGVDETPDDPDDGGWDWSLIDPAFTHGTGASPTNIYGATAQGMYYAYLNSSNPALLTAMTDAADVMIANPNIRSGGDMVFLMNYDDLGAVPGTTYQDAARAKYDGRITTYGSATALAEYIRDVRGVTQGYANGIIGWDIGIYAVIASMLDARYPGNGYDADADAIAEVLWQDSFNGNPGLFDVVADAGFDPTYVDKNFWWYTLGIGGLIDAFRASDTHTGEIPGLVTRLLDSQYPGGAISGSYGANAGDEDWQSTAYTVLTLAALDQSSYQPEINGMAGWINATQEVGNGAWIYGSGTHYPEICGENTAALYFGVTPTVSAIDPAGCISNANSCLLVPVVFERLDTTASRGVSVTIQLSSELALCTPNIYTDISVATGVGSWSEGYNNLNYQLIDNGGGSYTVDQAILGSPCGPTQGGVLFFVMVTKDAGVIADAVGTVTVSSVTVRDCDNAPLMAVPGATASVTIDVTAPTAPADLTATQQKTGNDVDGTTKINLAWTAPGGDADFIDIWRKGYGDYPEYNDGLGSVPAPPVTVGNGWALIATLPAATTAFVDEPATRDFWYYAAFVTDECGNISTASPMTGGTLNYHLGDVVDLAATYDGDNLVATSDVSHLGFNYGTALAPGDPLNYLDVGPTTDFSVDALPTTDNLVQFEDLMMFAINYGLVSKVANQPRPFAVNTIEMISEPADQVGSTFDVVLRMTGNGMVQGLSVPLVWDASVVEPLGVTAGDLVSRQGGLNMVVSAEPGTVDAALFGARNQGISGEGVLATMKFRVVGSGDPEIAIGEITARDKANAPVDINGLSDGGVMPVLPALSVLNSNVPNPFNPSTEFSFVLARTGKVNLSVYTMRGRLVKTLLNEEMQAGPHSMVWNGTDMAGRMVSSGSYLVRMVAPDVTESRNITLLK